MSDRGEHVCVMCGFTGTPPEKVFTGFASSNPLSYVCVTRLGAADLLFHVVTDTTISPEHWERCGPVVPAELHAGVHELPREQVAALVRGACVRAYGVERGEALVARLMAASALARKLDELRNYNARDVAVTAAVTCFVAATLPPLPPIVIGWYGPRLPTMPSPTMIARHRVHAFRSAGGSTSVRSLCGRDRNGRWVRANGPVEDNSPCAVCVHVAEVNGFDPLPISGDGRGGGP